MNIRPGTYKHRFPGDPLEITLNIRIDGSFDYHEIVDRVREVKSNHQHGHWYFDESREMMILTSPVAWSFRYLNLKTARTQNVPCQRVEISLHDLLCFCYVKSEWQENDVFPLLPPLQDEFESCIFPVDHTLIYIDALGDLFKTIGFGANVSTRAAYDALFNELWSYMASSPEDVNRDVFHEEVGLNNESWHRLAIFGDPTPFPHLATFVQFCIAKYGTWFQAIQALFGEEEVLPLLAVVDLDGLI